MNVLNKAIHWTSIKHVQCIKIYGYLVDIFYERMYAVLAVQGKLSRSCPNNISINSHKKTEDGMKRWLRRAKKR
ncbi:hypothetical protein NQ317_003988, partial [Molorchus minor]